MATGELVPRRVFFSTFLRSSVLCIVLLTVNGITLKCMHEYNNLNKNNRSWHRRCITKMHEFHENGELCIFLRLKLESLFGVVVKC